MKKNKKINDEKIKKDRKKALGLGVIVVLIFVIVGAIAWQDMVFGIIGFQTYGTFESEFASVNGGSQETGLRFAEIPHIKAEVGEGIRIRVKANQEGVEFSDNSKLFEIEQDGTIEFVPEEAGYHRVFIFITNKQGEYYFQDFRLLIEE